MIHTQAFTENSSVTLLKKTFRKTPVLFCKTTLLVSPCIYLSCLAHFTFMLLLSHSHSFLLQYLSHYMPVSPSVCLSTVAGFFLFVPLGYR